MTRVSSSEQFDRIRDTGVVGIVRGVTGESIVPVVDALQSGGVTTVEITADTPDAPQLIERIATRAEDDLLLGAGTVLDPETARSVLQAGAQFVVTPTLNRQVIEVANRYDSLVAPGVFTPTEAVEAFEAGADIVKIFPASTGGPSHVRSLRGPLSQIPTIPTGGITLENARSYFEAGAMAVGVGSALVDTAAIEAGEYETLETRAAEFIDVAAEAKQH